MQQSTRFVSAALVVLLAMLVAGPLAAADFTGIIKRASSSAITVERSGDSVVFEKAGKTTVGGKRSAWSELKQGDRVAVSWKISDKPPKAYRVTVLKKG